MCAHVRMCACVQCPPHIPSSASHLRRSAREILVDMLPAADMGDPTCGHKADCTQTCIKPWQSWRLSAMILSQRIAAGGGAQTVQVNGQKARGLRDPRVAVMLLHM